MGHVEDFPCSIQHPIPLFHGYAMVWSICSRMGHLAGRRNGHCGVGFMDISKRSIDWRCEEECKKDC